MPDQKKKWVVSEQWVKEYRGAYTLNSSGSPCVPRALFSQRKRKASSAPLPTCLPTLPPAELPACTTLLLFLCPPLPPYPLPIFPPCI